MDKCVALIAVFTISTNLIAAGRTYRGFVVDSHERFHHSFEHLDPDHWHSGYPGWEDRPKHNPNPGRDREYWRSHHNDDWHSNSGSYENANRSPENTENSYWHGPSLTNNWNDGPSVTWNQGIPPKWNQNNQGGNGNRPNANWNQGWNNNGQGNGGNGNIQPGNGDRPNMNWNQGWNNNNGGGGNTGNTPSIWNNAGSNNGNPATRTTTTPAPATQTNLATALCIRSCPVTSEYNPVCGSNNVTYGNAGRLECARYCGVDVSIRRNSPCAANQNFPSQPSEPAVDLGTTRFTTIEVPSTKPTISQDIINSIFTTQRPTTEGQGSTDDDNYDIDIRTRSRIGPIAVAKQYVYPVHI